MKKILVFLGIVVFVLFLVMLISNSIGSKSDSYPDHVPGWNWSWLLPHYGDSDLDNNGAGGGLGGGGTGSW